jgi:hypothetical protein
VAMKLIVRLGLVCAAGVLITIFFASSATASEGNDLNLRDQVVLNGRLIVAQGDTVDTAVLFHGAAEIEGTVTGSVVVLDGPTDISGLVQGDVFVFNGAVTVRSGARIDGDLVTSDTPSVAPGATIGGQQERVSTRFNAGAIGVASRIAWWIGYSISTLILGFLVLLWAPALDGAIDGARRERFGGAVGLGVATFFLLPIVAVLFLVIVIAIPLGLFLLLGLALIDTVGYVAGAHAIGRMIVKPPTSRFLAFLVGWLILRALALIPVVGGIAWTLATIFGLGLLWTAGRRSAQKPAPEPAIPPTPATA